ncbi:MAG: hypothetical protein ACLR09_03395 [Gallintestinimicrobium sp.]
MAHQKDGDRSSDVAQLLRVVGLLACFGLLAAACLEQKILAGALAGALSLLPAIQEALSELGERSWNLQKVCRIRSATSISQRAAGRKRVRC